MEPFADTVRAGPRAVLLTAVGGCLVALLLGAEPLKAWTDNLASSPMADAAGAAAGRWYGAMHAVGLDRPYRALHAAMRDARTVKFVPE
jgi:hypothetical protein